MGSRKSKKKKQAPHSRVKVGLAKKRNKKPIPVVLPGTKDSTEWTEKKTLTANYAALGLAADLTPAFGRNNTLRNTNDGDEELTKEETSTLGELAKTEDEVWRKAVGAQGEDPAPPRRLTTTQIRIVKDLVDAHGADLGAMWRDRTLNPMQHTVAVLRNMVRSYHAHPKLAGGGPGQRDFRAPRKSLGGRA